MLLPRKGATPFVYQKRRIDRRDLPLSSKSGRSKLATSKSQDLNFATLNKSGTISNDRDDMSIISNLSPVISTPFLNSLFANSTRDVLTSDMTLLELLMVTPTDSINVAYLNATLLLWMTTSSPRTEYARKLLIPSCHAQNSMMAWCVRANTAHEEYNPSGCPTAHRTNLSPLVNDLLVITSTQCLENFSPNIVAITNCCSLIGNLSVALDRSKLKDSEQDIFATLVA